MPETDVKRISAAQLKKLYGGRTRKENLGIMLNRINQRLSEVRLISGCIPEPSMPHIVPWEVQRRKIDDR